MASLSKPHHLTGRPSNNRQHGLTNSPTYRTWRSMKSRCDNPKAKSYAVYGGRGITYAPSWKTFSNFLRDMGPRPEGTTLDRINGELGYCQFNCRWATKSVQRRNRL